MGLSPDRGSEKIFMDQLLQTGKPEPGMSANLFCQFLQISQALTATPGRTAFSNGQYSDSVGTIAGFALTALKICPINRNLFSKNCQRFRAAIILQKEV